MSDAIYLRDECEARLTAAAAVEAGEVYQLADGRAGVKTGLNAAASGDRVNFTTEGQFTVTKTSGKVVLDGAPLWWDHSANACTPVPPLVTGDRDFYLGVAVGDATSAATTCVVNLNVQPVYEVDWLRDPGATALVGNATLTQRGGKMTAAFSTAAEAQKADWISQRSFTVASNPILEAVINVVTDADADVGDLSVGFANATHASDMDAATETVLFHLNLSGADLNIYAESDDGTTEVAATDTTVDFAVGTPVHLVIDGRDPSDMRFYVNGVEVLNATANLGNIALATGPLKALFHVEKSSNDTAGSAEFSMLRVRTAQQ